MPQATKRIVFVAAHLLSATIASGGDVLFCELAARIAKRRPEWHFSVLAPDFAQAELSKYFESVVTLPTPGREGKQGGAVSTALAWARRSAGTADTLTAARPDLVHSTGDFFVDVAPVVRARRRIQFRWSGVVHHVNAAPLSRKNTLAVATASYLLQRRSFQMLRAADSISVLNEGVRAQLREMRFDSGRVHVVGAGIEVEKFPVIPIANRKHRIVWLNRLEPTKGLLDLPRIVADLPPGVTVDVIGRGPDVHVMRLKQELRRAGVSERVVLHGFLTDAQMHDRLSNAGAFISCSYEEGWGISIAEALATGLPCVAYDLPSHREIFGRLITRVPLGDTSGFASAVIQALENDTAELRAARHAAARQFSLDECALRQEAAFEALIP